MTARIRAATVVAALAVAGVVLSAAPVAAHPLGNFTVNRYSGLVVAAGELRVHHVLDLAEIPALQAEPDVDTNGDGSFSPAELNAYAASTCRRSATAMTATLNGRTLPMAVETGSAQQRPGQGGLSTLRVECELRAPLPALAPGDQLNFRDAAADDRLGWREITARGDGVTLTAADVPESSRSGELTAYPQDLLDSPLDQRAATLGLRPGGPRLTEQESSAGGEVSRGGGLTAAFTALAGSAERSGAWWSLLLILLSVVVGATHALAPGHGKTVMAFYLAGRDRSASAALTVGATVTATHTAGVLVLGLIVSASATFAPASAYPWLTAASGALIAVVGLVLLRDARRAWARRRAEETVKMSAAAQQPVTTTVGHGHDHPGQGDHGHDHDGHQHNDHQHSHSHGGGRPHTHGPTTSRSGLIAIGVAGGLLPSPTAVVVLLGAVGLGRPWFGVLLVLAFGLGMAATLTAAGLLVLRTRRHLERRRRTSGLPGPLAVALDRLPVLTGSVVLVVGVVLTVRGLTGALGG